MLYLQLNTLTNSFKRVLSFSISNMSLGLTTYPFGYRQNETSSGKYYSILGSWRLTN